MAESELHAITAIKDMVQEGSIAASLHRLGWKVLYRATSPELLIQNLATYPEALILLSDDFLDPRVIQQRNIALIRGQSAAISAIGEKQPRNDFELSEFLRTLSRAQVPSQIVIPATQSRVIAFTSTQGGVGTTTLAINVADQISAQGRAVLLVDAYPGRESIASHFEVHDIRSTVRELHENLSLFEISELSQLIHLAKIAQDYDYIILDLGVLIEKSISGARVADQTFQWLLHSQGKLLITCGSCQKAIDKNLRFATQIREKSPLFKVESVIRLDSPLPRRARAKLASESSERSSIPTSTFSWESKSVAVARERATTLRLSVPRSLVHREIGRFTNERVMKK